MLRTHAPRSQKSPVGQSVFAEQAAAQLPEMQNGADSGQSLADAQLVLEGLGSQTDLVHVNPVAHGVESLQADTHRPSAHTSPPPHWLL